LRTSKRSSNGGLVLGPVRPSAAVRANYDARLRRLIDEMSNSVIYWLSAAWRREEERIAEVAGMALDAPPSTEMQRVVRRLRRRWQRRFNEGSEDLARYFASKVHERTDGELRRVLKRADLTVKLQLSRPIQGALRAIVDENVSLIRSIPSQYLDQVEGSVMRSVLAGRDLKSLTEELQHHHGVIRRRAELISLDQNQKASSAIERLKYLELGIERAIWRHSGAGKEPRPTHVANNHKEFSVRDGWYDPHEKAYIRPGQLINCRCYSQPIVEGI
jgi:uncharacterized protein with gpF-like domain